MAAALLLIVCNGLMLLGTVFLVRWWIRRQAAAIVDQVATELVKLVNGEPCQAAAVLNAIGRVVGSEAGRSAKASLMADLAHVKRAENSAAADQQLALIQDQNPGIGGILAGIPAGKRSKLMGNPLVQIAASMLMGGGGFGGPGPGNGQQPPGGGSVRDRLRKGG